MCRCIDPKEVMHRVTHLIRLYSAFPLCKVKPGLRVCPHLFSVFLDTIYPSNRRIRIVNIKRSRHLSAAKSPKISLEKGGVILSLRGFGRSLRSISKNTGRAPYLTSEDLFTGGVIYVFVISSSGLRINSKAQHTLSCLPCQNLSTSFKCLPKSCDQIRTP